MTISFGLVKTSTRRFLFERRNRMFTTNLPHDEVENALPEWHEPFPEPQTIPARWDLSEVLTVPSFFATDNAEISAKS